MLAAEALDSVRLNITQHEDQQCYIRRVGLYKLQMLRSRCNEAHGTFPNSLNPRSHRVVHVHTIAILSLLYAIVRLVLRALEAAVADHMKLQLCAVSRLPLHRSEALSHPSTCWRHKQVIEHTKGPKRPQALYATF